MAVKTKYILSSNEVYEHYKNLRDEAYESFKTQREKAEAVAKAYLDGYLKAIEDMLSGIIQLDPNKDGGTDG